MYTFEFETLTSDLVITVFGENYKDAIDKIREMGIPDLKKGHLKLVSVFESYDDAMYIGELEGDVDKPEESTEENTEEE